MEFPCWRFSFRRELLSEVMLDPSVEVAGSTTTSAVVDDEDEGDSNRLVVHFPPNR